MMARRITLLLVAALAAVALVAGPAAAVHEANNSFDMAATTAQLPDADAVGISNFADGSNGWSNQVRASGLAPEVAVCAGSAAPREYGHSAAR